MGVLLWRVEQFDCDRWVHYYGGRGGNLTDRVTDGCVIRVVGGGNSTDRVTGECIIRVARVAI